MRWIIQQIKIVDEEPDEEDKIPLPEIKLYQDLGAADGYTEPEWGFPAWAYDYVATTKKLVVVANNKVYYEE